MIEKIKNNRYLKLFFDGRNLGIYAIAIIALSVAWSSVKIIEKNYQLEKQISQMQQEVDILEQETKNQKLKNQYFRTDAYLELAARKYFGKSLAGEKLILVPRDVAAKYIPDVKTVTANQDKKSDMPKFVENWQNWLNFFLHRHSE